MKKVNVIVPVYADWGTLRLNIKSMSKFYGNNKLVNVFYVNDCGPEVDYLERKIKESIKGFSNFRYYRNKENLGFVKNNNNAVAKIIKKSGDVLFLNSDTKVTKYFIESLQEVLYSEDNIGIVTPRSNNATIWSIPMNGSLAGKPVKSHKLWTKLSKKLPRYYISPTAHGFCMLVRRIVIDEIGVFDEIYGKGYGEENDFTMRARKAGWLSATDNRSFVFHYESRSFGDEARIELSNNNRKILDKRYPDYTKLLNDYLDSLDENFKKKDSLKWRITSGIYRVLEEVHHNGYKSTYSKINKKIKQKIKVSRVKTAKKSSGIKIWSNEMTNSGAPLVLCSVIDEILSVNDNIKNNIELFYPDGCRVDGSFLDKIRNKGVKTRVDTGNERLFSKGDIVFLNSSGYNVGLYEDIVTALESGVLKRLYFYIHEDSPEWVGLNSVAFVNIKNRLTDLINSDKVFVYLPSKKTKQNWSDFFDTDKNITIMPGKISIDKDDFIEREEEEFDKINFIISGTVEPRKMQLSVLGAFDCFYRLFYEGNESKYRDWSLKVVGAYDNEPSNIYNKNVLKYNGKYDKIEIIHKTTSSRAIELAKLSNVTIMYSTDESYSMVAMEGMAFGHVLIRSEASGVDEQIVDGVNGFIVSTEDLSSLVISLEKILSKNNARHITMSKESSKIARDSISSKYTIVQHLKADI